MKSQETMFCKDVEFEVLSLQGGVVHNDEEYFDVISIVKDYPEYFVITYPEDDTVSLKNLVDEAGSNFIL